MDDWNASEPAQIAAGNRASNQPGPVTTPLTPARSFMDDIGESKGAKKRQQEDLYKAYVKNIQTKQLRETVEKAGGNT
jgi:hypothetical protein